MKTTVVNTINEEIDLLQIFRILLSNIWLILGSVLLSVIIALVYSTIAKPQYLALSTVQVEQKQSTLPGLDDLAILGQGESDSNTEIEILKSGLVLGPVVDDLRLQLVLKPKYFPFVGEYLARKNSSEGKLSKPFLWFDSFNTGGEYIEVSGLVLPDYRQGEIFRLVAGEASEESYSIFDEKNQLVVQGRVGSTATNADNTFSILVSKIRSNPNAEFELSVSRRVDSISTLRENLSVFERGKNTGVIALSLKGYDPKKITVKLDRITSSYLEQNISRTAEEANQGVEFLEVQIPIVRKELEVSEQELNDYRSESSSVDMALETEAALQKMVVVQQQLSELKLKESEISQKYRRDHPLYLILLKQRAELATEEAALNADIELLPDTQQKLFRLTRDVEVNNSVYVQLLSKIQELRLIRAGTVGNVRILEPAYVFNKQVSPKKGVILLLALVLGFLFGVVISLVKAFLNSGMSNPNQIQDELNLALYGVVPLSKEQPKLEDSHQILACSTPTDSAIESIRGIRTSLHFAMLDAPNNIVMMTGPSPGIGKSFISSNLAVLLGQTGQKVLLIDLDMRRGRIHSSFNVGRNNGMSDILSRDKSLSDVVHQNIVENVDFISTGEIPPNPSELIMSKSFKDMLDSVQVDYDIVLLDTPPVLAVTDAFLVSQLVGTTMMVARHNSNSIKEFQQALKELSNVGCIPKGYIYNCMEYELGAGMPGYKNRYYNYDYSS